ncbi:3-oxoadipate enol-lactonase [Allorhizocola rhizosphaerae]|uniref:3-oxoadipate enol-lactonase n=1 Tax=Allorhizocola rhizosphaerae TaxID=1872709 RepID=UPI000E3CB11B|nr:3-oxoadipate enol-lactonase [Allorhizocola rhizosphaerae]
MKTVHLHYSISGRRDGPALVLGGSLGTTGAIWQPQVEALGEAFRVIRYDHRGHGGSPSAGGGRYQIEDLGKDLIALLDDLEITSAHLAGVSLGGMVGMWVAAHAPTRVRKLALICTSARLGPPEMWAERASLVRAGGMAAVADTVLSRWFTPEFHRRSPAVAAWARNILMSTRPEEYAACCAALAEMNLEPLLPSIICPTLVVAGEQDHATPPEHAVRIAEEIPLAELEFLPDAAHLANVERPNAVNSLLKEFLGVQ